VRPTLLGVLAGMVPASLILAAALLRPALWPSSAEAEIAAGARLYQKNCASCHGAHLEGQPHWWEVGADGYLPAPPHDASGHSWQHSDAELHELIADSLKNIAPPDYRTRMPAFADALSPAEIDAVIAFIKSTWPPGVQAYQATRNPGGPKLGQLTGNWNFPPSCSLRFGAAAEAAAAEAR
jgi:mono/diheme cytochrome c family protein